MADDPLVEGRLATLCAQQGLTLRVGLDLPETGSPTMLVCPVPDHAALTALKAHRQRWPRTLLVGYLRLPDQELWRLAERSGCDLVATRGALPLALRALFERRSHGGGRRFPLLDIADAAGRLGFVQRFEDTPAGAVALYRVDGQWCAIKDFCPHAGARLSEGALDGTVVTCPQHGSQFDVRTGERLRGPADQEVASLRLVEDAGQLWLLDPAG